ncbi:hypothetical protein LG329_17795 [Virgibacillus necropolis]|uniref:hypothetical protein n=1 Tax=Virgibacillus necropolis TaxID=163877 RepID=UPI00384FC385
MEDQEFIDIELNNNESLAGILQEVVEKKREETGSYNIIVQNVIPVGGNQFTIILREVVSITPM